MIEVAVKNGRLPWNWDALISNSIFEQKLPISDIIQIDKSTANSESYVAERMTVKLDSIIVLADVPHKSPTRCRMMDKRYDR